MVQKGIRPRGGLRKTNRMEANDRGALSPIPAWLGALGCRSA